MRKEIKEINVKDLVEEINTSSVAGEVIKKGVKRKRTENEYTYLFVSGCDFALNRRTLKTNKTLVSIRSKDILFIYDEIKELKTEITDAKQIKSFFNDKLADDYVIEAGLLNYAPSGIDKSDIDFWFTMLKTESEAAKYLMKKGLLLFNTSKNSSYSHDLNTKYLDACYECNPSLLAAVFENFRCNSLSEYNSILHIVTCMYHQTDLNIAKYFIEKLGATSVEFRYLVNYDNFEVIKKYNLNGRRFIDYILFDLYKQGVTSLNLRTYVDYLEQSINYYGKIKEKYPKNLETDHYIISMKVRERVRLKAESPKFAEIMAEAEDFSYRNTLDPFEIVMPKVSTDLVDEGQYLCHCVASYVEKVNNGDCLVVFMRRKDELDVPYLTVEILPDRSVPQVEGMCKRDELTDEEKVFINRWAKFKHLKITAQNAIMDKKAMKEKEIA